mmetsp:Transcript_55956/g.81835  ORF Transcript_55956/g.81835 Transcript_55956/m.81835 type:complete len:554 (+) Transcript_55956:63-1724(+)
MERANPIVTPLLTDMYQLTMAYAYWKAGRHNEPSVFDLFFRKCPFKGQFCVFAGLSEVLQFCSTFKFKAEEIEYLRKTMECDEGYFEYLSALDCSDVKIYALQEGTVCFPRVPLLRVVGPLGICQLLETTLLNLVNFPSLVATQAARLKLAAGPGKTLLEFGLRRAQGPNGGLSASRYAYLGGFHATSNVQAGFNHDIPVKGTHAHSFVMSYTSFDEVEQRMLAPASGGEPVDFVALVLEQRERLGFTETNEGELAAFTAYALSFPNGFLALVDTYDTLTSGNRNFAAVAFALRGLGYRPVGVRLDSGDLAALSRGVKAAWRELAETNGAEWLTECQVVASNDINEKSLLQLNEAGHQIDVFGIGTHLATCQQQPALGCVYKLAALRGTARMKLSQELGKASVPGPKRAYRLYGADGRARADLLAEEGEPAPEAGREVICVDPADPENQSPVVPSAVKDISTLVFDGQPVGEDSHGSAADTLQAARARLEDDMGTFESATFALDPGHANKYDVALSAQLSASMCHLRQQLLGVSDLNSPVAKKLKSIAEQKSH